MEILRECPVSSIEARNIKEWPKVPTYDLKATQITEANDQINLPKSAQIAPDEPILKITEGTQDTLDTRETENTQKARSPQVTQSAEDSSRDLNSPRDVVPAAKQSEAAESLKKQPTERQWFNLGRLALKKSTWPNPELSIGSKCRRIGDRECWEAVGPAQLLFNEISQSIGDLLDARVDEIEEGEPVAGNILTYGMYMIGREPTTARPTLIFTCERPKPRRRAIKFVKESEILKGRPKIALAESSVVPMAMGRNYLRLLAGSTVYSGPSSTTWIARRNATTTHTPINTPVPYSGLSTGAKAGIAVGSVFGGLSIMLAVFVLFYFRRRKRFTRKYPPLPFTWEAVATGRPGSPKPAMLTIPQMSDNSDPPLGLFQPAAQYQPSAEYQPGHGFHGFGHTYEVVAGAELGPVSEMSSVIPENPNLYAVLPQSLSAELPASEPVGTEVLPAMFHSSHRIPVFSEQEPLHQVSLHPSRPAPDPPELLPQRSLTSVSALPTRAPPPVPYSGGENPVVSSGHISLPTTLTAPPPRNSPSSNNSSTAVQEIGKVHNPITQQPQLLHFEDSLRVPGMTTHARNLMKGLQDHRATSLPSSAYASSWDMVLSSEDSEHHKDAAPSLLDCASICGMSILSQVTGRVATIGGVVVLNNKLYGLTVRHSVIDSARKSQVGDIESVNGSSTDQNDDFEFAFDSEDEENTSEADISDAIITSRASVSTAASVSRISSTISGSSDKAHVSIPSSMGAALSYNGEEPSKSTTTITEFTIPFATSTQRGHDWALFELSQESVREAKKALEGNSLFAIFNVPQHLASMPSKDTEIIAAKGGSGVSRGVLSPSSTMMKSERSCNFQEVWTVRFNSPLVEGDSGSWVCDSVTGDLYGHIVAGIPEIGLAYILPAHKIFQEIEEVVGPVEFASKALA
ncbi:uncharacterized protein LY89DRAFT_473235 [Mollisia scopiformis]|uniref:Serine protease n=1 Tax=Mollisia scopiformis TaxID=149040 RepID=A0A194XIW2_MOLSC|nr:uncharacterized protein LY89DRAFT_473235 [Mollisia scopiformis]KUJ20175.1 hypothetical protein LY89DRAFT_473235 [Mollisia scopiformis]